MKGADGECLGGNAEVAKRSEKSLQKAMLVVDRQARGQDGRRCVGNCVGMRGVARGVVEE